MFQFVPWICATVLIVVLLAIPSLAYVGPFTIPVDESSSGVTVELCIPGGCDSDFSGVSGYFAIALDDNVNPALIDLHDFDLSLTDTIDINISVPFGGLTAIGESLRLLYAQPGTPFGPVPIEGNAFLFVDVPTNAEGTVAYNATGLVCVALQAAGLPCTDTRDLGEQGTQSGNMDGTIVVEDGVATLTINPDVEVPLDPDHPELGTLSVTGTVVGSATVPAAIPAVSEWGMVTMTLLLITAGTLVFVRRRAVEA